LILVRSRPATGEAYWVDLKQYFSDPTRRRSRRIVFDKVRDRFDTGAKAALFAVGKSLDAGLYTPPIPREEPIFSNLIPVTRLPARLFLASTHLSDTKSVFGALREVGAVPPPAEWLLKEKRILSAVDLRAPEWRRIVDAGTVDDFSPSEWADADDEDKRRDFVTLLNRCLTARFERLHVRWDKEFRHYYFLATRDLKPRTVSYGSVKQKATRDVFSAYEYKNEARRALGTPAYYRHNAVEARFLRLDRQWLLALSPTYRFTSDGRAVHPFYESKLKGIKALENNQAVLGQVAMWASFLADPVGDLFNQESYPHLGFGPLAEGRMQVGVDESSWLAPGAPSGGVNGAVHEDAVDGLVYLADQDNLFALDLHMPPGSTSAAEDEDIE
jgi:hypothetical protein